ncbi:dicarboxylic amino acid permease [Magnaporthiopsis poae ATCC 64411]|uniref:Dicarboxylic amino acid permease n=1 Tax=Magnaporthiopsis poae (strain ATCC 64411 / 73-15) TaxID=644358 RepID=A0A0C4E0N8_MAGP6|nr:dicarboxylic amino acid permease [Magnaporthiopsis poae ATCC 64411]
MLVRSDDPNLGNSTGTAAQSPFVIAAKAAGISAIPSVVNAVVITSAWSASNQSLLAGTRVLFGLALKRQAPAVFLRTTSWGTPYVCVLFFAAFMLLSFLSLSNGALTVFEWFVALTSAGVLISWSTILFNHIRLLRAIKVQGLSKSRLPWHNEWTVYSSPVALAMCIIILLTGGYEVFVDGRWEARSFVSHYLDIPLVLCGYLAWKYTKKTTITSLADIPLEEAFQHVEQNPEPVEKVAKGWILAISWLWD